MMGSFPPTPQNSQGGFPHMTSMTGFGFPPYPWMMGQGNSQSSIPDLSGATIPAPELSTEPARHKGQTQAQQQSASVQTTHNVLQSENSERDTSEKIEPMDVDKEQEVKSAPQVLETKRPECISAVETAEKVEPAPLQATQKADILGQKANGIEEESLEVLSQQTLTKKRKDSPEDLQTKSNIPDKTPKKSRSEVNSSQQTPLNSPLENSPTQKSTPRVSVPLKKRLEPRAVGAESANKREHSTIQYESDSSTTTVPISSRLGNKTPPITARLGDKLNSGRAPNVGGDPSSDLSESRSAPSKKEESKKAKSVPTPLAIRSDRQILTGEDGPVIVVQQETSSTYSTPIMSRPDSPTWNDTNDNGENITIKLVDDEIQETDARKVTIDDHGWNDSFKHETSSHGRSNSVARSPVKSSSEDVVFRVC